MEGLGLARLQRYPLRSETVVIGDDGWCSGRRCRMRTRLLNLIGAAVVIVSALVFFKPAQVTVAQESPTASVTPPASAPVLKTPWGEPDLQGIWTDEFDMPLQRPAEYANQEFFTDAQRQELDTQRAQLFGSDPRQKRGTAVDVGGAYNTAFLTIKHAGARTSLIVDCRPAQRPDSATDAGGTEGCGGGSGVSPGPVAINRSVQEQGARMCRRQVRSDALAAIRRTPSALPHR